MMPGRDNAAFHYERVGSKEQAAAGLARSASSTAMASLRLALASCEG
jgi:hypothetical protein